MAKELISCCWASGYLCWLRQKRHCLSVTLGGIGIPWPAPRCIGPNKLEHTEVIPFVKPAPPTDMLGIVLFEHKAEANGKSFKETLVGLVDVTWFRCRLRRRKAARSSAAFHENKHKPTPAAPFIASPLAQGHGMQFRPLTVEPMGQRAAIRASRPDRQPRPDAGIGIAPAQLGDTQSSGRRENQTIPPMRSAALRTAKLKNRYWEKRCRSCAMALPPSGPRTALAAKVRSGGCLRRGDTVRRRGWLRRGISARSA